MENEGHGGLCLKMFFTNPHSLKLRYFHTLECFMLYLYESFFQVLELQEKLDSMEDIGEVKHNGGGGHDSDES